ncbi:hypothetical protein EPD60_13855 [Flaviaesturariibacter flavus]|uniref:Uncharacterized protein n=1 Tax=Flaviaesturariibacter flavus TaxID=2502780 RepID=A0A4R1B8B7_9BACT|nr:hypothetical protein [Flaviaesturariibacter flavus]TCJ13148.1 hypothetical protein EPD60_13855 [Flaviaesturariibacter flavus]
MPEKQYEAARNNEQSPAPGFASVNTHNPSEEDEQRVQTTQQERHPRSKDDSPLPRPEAAEGSEGNG